MEFSMQARIQITLLAQPSAFNVSASPPEKYALRKLPAYGKGLQNTRVKISKDLTQVASLIEYLAKNDTKLLSGT